jgi:hypothetical protein
MHNEMHMVICLTGRCWVPGALPLSYAGLCLLILCVIQRLWCTKCTCARLLLLYHPQVSIPRRSFNEKEDNHQLFGPLRSNGQPTMFNVRHGSGLIFDYQRSNVVTLPCHAMIPGGEGLSSWSLLQSNRS